MIITRVQEVYVELEKYVIALDPDPVSRGPRYLQGLIATCRNYLNSVSKLMLEIHQEKQNLSRDLRAMESAFSVSFDYMLANDERIRRLPNIEDRKSTARVYLRDEIQAIENTKARLHDLEFVDKAVRHRHRELSSTMGEIKLQKSLIATEIATGAMYGDERSASGSPINQGPAGVDINEDELEAMFADELNAKSPSEAVVLTAQPPVQPELDSEEPRVTGKPTEAAVAAFLGVVDDTGASGENYDDVFENL